MEHLGQHALGLSVAVGNVDPEESIAARHELGELRGAALLGLSVRDPVDLHGRVLLGGDLVHFDATAPYNGTNAILASEEAPCSTS
jgi:hypothetical protein